MKSASDTLGKFLAVFIAIILFNPELAVFRIVLLPAFFILTAFRLFYPDPDARSDRINILLMVTAFSILPSFLNSTKYYKDLTVAASLFLGVCIFIMLRSRSDSGGSVRKNILAAILIYTSCQVIISLDSFYNSYVAFGFNFAKKNVIFGSFHPNSFSCMLNMVFPFLAGLYSRSQSKVEKAGLLVLSVMFALSIILTFSKIAYVLMILNILFLIYMMFRPGIRTMVVFVLFVSICAWIFMPGVLKERFEQLIKGKYFLDRIRIWSIGTKISAEHPLVGSGYAAYKSKCTMYRPRNLYADFQPMGSYEHAHNLFIQWLLAYGAGSLLLLMGCGWYMARNCGKDEVFIFFLFVFTANALVDYNFFWYKNIVVFFCLCGISVKRVNCGSGYSVIPAGFLSMILVSLSLLMVPMSWVDHVMENASVQKRFSRLERFTGIALVHSKYQDVVGAAHFMKGEYESAEESFQKAIRYSDHEDQLYLRSALSKAAQQKPFEDDLNRAGILNPPDDAGYVQIGSGLIYDLAGKKAEALQCFTEVVIKYPEFILNQFLDFRPELKNEILARLKSAVEKNSPDLGPHYLLRVCEAFFHAGEYALSENLFGRIDPSCMNRTPKDELDYLDMMRFAKEFRKMSLRLGKKCDIPEHGDFRNDEVLNLAAINMFRAGKYDEAVKFAEKLCLERNYIVENSMVNSRIPDGLFYGVMAALNLDRRETAQNFIVQMYCERISHFTAFLAQAFFEMKYGSRANALENLKRFHKELSVRSNILYLNWTGILALELYWKRGIIPGRLGWNYPGLRQLLDYSAGLSSEIMRGMK